ncbi:unnamed protein product [Prunus armeniaca]|uniref:Uncharacterized protein n=1 Tax=Prunus armeniaca TaxID=36596 RepID=A0A6J5XCI0_PRUAR|nr:unnamed protein product [Prunus armeniaca]
MVIGDFGSQELELGARARHSELGILVSLLFVLRSAKAGWKYLRPPFGLFGFGVGLPDLATWCGPLCLSSRAGPWVICAHGLLRIRRKLELGSGLGAGPCHFQSPISFMSWPFVVISLGSTFVGLCSWCETLDHLKLELGHLKFGENFPEKVGYGCHSVSLGVPLNAVEFEAASHWVVPWVEMMAWSCDFVEPRAHGLGFFRFGSGEVAGPWMPKAQELHVARKWA